MARAVNSEAAAQVGEAPGEQGEAAQPPDDDLAVRDYDFDDQLITESRQTQEPRLRVYTPEHPMVVLGRGSRIGTELDLEACRRDEVPVYRRHGGGCAVVLDPGNVVVSLALPVPGFGGNQAHFRKISDWLIAALELAGFPGLQQHGISDLVHGERKVGGACIYRPPGLLYYSISLLVSPRVELMERYLRHPPREPSYRRGRPHDQFVGVLLEGESDDTAALIAEELRQQLELEQLHLVT